MFLNISSVVSPGKGTFPVRQTYMMTPIDQMSLAVVTCLLITSGAMYRGVPLTCDLTDFLNLISLDNPKSINLTFDISPLF